MSLFDKISTSLSQVAELFAKPDAGAKDALSETSKAAPTNFWMNLFGGKNTTTGFNQNAGLNNAARQINLSNDNIKANLAREAARLNPSAQIPEYKEGVQANGTYIAKILPSDVGKARWSKEIDPADISRAALKKAAVGLGIANDTDEAQKIVDNIHVNGLTTHTNKGTRFVDKTDVGFAAWMKQHTDRQGRWPVQAGTDDIALLRDSARQLKIGNPEVAIANGNKPTQQANAGVLLGGAMALPKLAQQLPKAAVLAGEAAPPILIVSASALGTAVLVDKYVEVSRSNWEDLQKAKVMPLPIPMPDFHMDDTGDAPPARPTDTAERPTQPQAQPIPDANTQPGQEITVRPNTQPQVKPETKVDDLPQPYTPDVPKGTPQSEPPKIDPSKVIPPIIAGASLGKLAIDKMNKTDIAPNGVEKINKREWTEAEYKHWFENLHTIKTPRNTAADLYEIEQTGELNYTISGGGEKFNADGIADTSVLEAKFVVNPERSLSIKDSKLPEFLRKRMEEKGIRSELSRLNKILRDDSNPLSSVRIITNNEKAIPYLTELMKEYNVPGEVVVK